MRVTPSPRLTWGDVIERDHRADAEMLHLDGNRSADAPLLSGRRDRKSRAALLILLLLFELSAVALPVLARVPSRSAAAITQTRLRAAPDPHAEPLLRLPEGATVMVHGKAENGWYRVRHGQLEGYVLTGDLATEPLVSTGDRQSGEAPARLERRRVGARNSRPRPRAPKWPRSGCFTSRLGRNHHREGSQSPAKPESGRAGDSRDAPRRAGGADGGAP